MSVEHPIRRELIAQATERLADIIHMDVMGCSPWLIERGLARLVHDYGISADLMHSYDFWKASIVRSLKEIALKGAGRSTPRKRIIRASLNVINDTAKSMATSNWPT